MPIPELGQLGYEVTPLDDRWEVHLIEGQSIDPVVDFIRARGLNLRHLVEKRQTLEDLFLQTHQDGNQTGDENRGERSSKNQGLEGRRGALMKYLAIFKDSLREARDSWVLLGLLVMASLVILFVVSLSFEPVSAERTMRLFFAPRPDAPARDVRCVEQSQRRKGRARATGLAAL
jgi:hypothetical protein